MLGLDLVHSEAGFAILDHPDGGRVEVFGESSGHSRHFTHPVAGFLVEDLEAAVRELEAAGVEIVQPLKHAGDGGWVHFRAPDANLYELVRDPRQL